MINLPDYQDDIYLNALIRLAFQNRDKKSPYDVDSVRRISSIVIPYLEGKLSDLFLESCQKTFQVDLCEELFTKGYACERGIGQGQDFDQAMSLYQEAYRRGSVEAIFRMGWLIENHLASLETGETAEDCYKKAADIGHVKSLIACGQFALFAAETIEDLDASCKYFEWAKLNEPLASCEYLDIVENLIQSARCGKEWSVLESLDFILPIAGHFKKGDSPHYQENIESNIRLARYLHEHNVLAGSLFLSWCLMTGAGISENRQEGKRIASHFSDSKSSIIYFYTAWMMLQAKSSDSIEKGLRFLRQSAMKGLSAAKDDVDYLIENDLLSPQSILEYLGSDHRPLLYEHWFSFGDGWEVSL